MTPLPLRILLVADRIALAQELQRVLACAGPQQPSIHHVETLGQALRLLGPHRFRFDCVVTCLRLPDADGLGVVQRLRARDAHTAIVVIASLDDRERANESLRHGAQEVLLHPWLPTQDSSRDLVALIGRAADYKCEQDRPTTLAVSEGEGTPKVFPRDDEGAFAMRFQPWACVEDGSICGVEALLAARPAHGTPREILSAAETRGDLDALSQWVLRRVAPEWRQWRERAIAPPCLSVNIAPSELRTRHFARSRLALIEELGLAPAELQIELAEDALVGAGAKALEEIQALRAAGIRVVADNVGRSQVALLALGRLPLDGVKLDISLVESVRHRDRASRGAVRGLVALCNELGLRCCAVGVEVEPDAIACRELGVHSMQGYWVARPQSPSATAAWLARCEPLRSTA